MINLNDSDRKFLSDILAGDYRYQTDNDKSDPPGESLRLGYVKLTNDKERALFRTILEETIKAPGKTKVTAYWSRLGPVDLSKLDLTLSDFQEALMQGANLEGANLTNACLSDTQLQKANLKGATLAGDRLRANFEWADLSNANLKEAENLDGVKLWGAKLNNAEFSDIKTQLTREQTIFAQGITAKQRKEVYSQINNWVARAVFTGASYVLAAANTIPRAIETAHHHLQRQR